jgi:hypothetical protein
MSGLPGFTPPPAEDFSCPQATAEGKRSWTMYQSSQVAANAGRRDHLTRTYVIAALPFFTNLLSST